MPSGNLKIIPWILVKSKSPGGFPRAAAPLGKPYIPILPPVFLKRRPGFNERVIPLPDTVSIPIPGTPRKLFPPVAVLTAWPRKDAPQARSFPDMAVYSGRHPTRQALKSAAFFFLRTEKRGQRDIVGHPPEPLRGSLSFSLHEHPPGPSCLLPSARTGPRPRNDLPIT